MKYEVCIYNISQYLQMARNKLVILQMSQPAQTRRTTARWLYSLWNFDKIHVIERSSDHEKMSCQYVIQKRSHAY